MWYEDVSGVEYIYTMTYIHSESKTT